MGVDVGIDAETDTRLATAAAGELVQDPEFLRGFAVEGSDSGKEGGIQFLVRLSDTGIDDRFRGETTMDGPGDFISGNTVRAPLLDLTA